jgi:hypothetical protein
VKNKRAVSTAQCQILEDFGLLSIFLKIKEIQWVSDRNTAIRFYIRVMSAEVKTGGNFRTFLCIYDVIIFGT